MDIVKLTAKEEEIMNFFWSRGDLFVKEIQEFYKETKPHFNTLSTIVRTLEDKGFLAHRSYGNTYQYYAIISKDKFKQKSLKEVIGKYYNNSVFTAVSSLVEEEALSLEDLRELINIVEKGKL